MVAFRRPKSLKDILVHSEFKHPGLRLFLSAGIEGVRFVNPWSRGSLLAVGLLVEAI